jgi:hypothetical protein
MVSITRSRLKNIIKIQCLTRKRFTKKRLCIKKDKMSLILINRLLDKHIEVCSLYNEINKTLDQRKCRNPNFPSEISENLVKFAFQRKYNVVPCWDIKKGDLTVNLFTRRSADTLTITKRLEVKGFTSAGPSSFGPTESWNQIYFVDAIDFRNKHFKIHEINLSNRDSTWRDIKVNQIESYNDQCKQKRRPRICFNNLIKQIDDEHHKVIFDGHIDMLIND